MPSKPRSALQQGISSGPSAPDDSLDSSNGLRTLQQELADCRRLARQAEERLRLAMDVGRLGTWHWSIPDNQITREGYHEELFGLAPGSFSGTYEGFLACLHPEDREPVQQEITRCLTSRQDYRQEYRVLWPNGSVHWMEGRARIECDEQGEPVRMMGVVQDITERKLVEDQHFRFRALFEAAQDAVLIADDDRRFVEANPAAGELLGLRPEEIRGRRIEEFVEEVQGSGVSAAWQQFQTTGVQRGECRLRRADGALLEVEYSASTNFVPGLHLSILRDVSERKRAEQALTRLAAEVAHSNADLQQFAYVTSHDLQEPLRGIINFSQLLTKRYRGQLDAEADTVLDYIVSGAYRMKGLIDSLLTYSRVVNVEALPLAPVPLEAALHWAAMNLHTVMEEAQASVTQDQLPTVTADHVQLVQLFQNLISNAIKYRKRGEPPQIHVSAEERGQDCLVSVRDNGIGIHPGHADRIFGVFKRLHGQEIPGTGIGLAICKRIVDKHGGQIWVESKRARRGRGAGAIRLVAGGLNAARADLGLPADPPGDRLPNTPYFTTMPEPLEDPAAPAPAASPVGSATPRPRRAAADRLVAGQRGSARLRHLRLGDGGRAPPVLPGALPGRDRRARPAARQGAPHDRRRAATPPSSARCRRTSPSRWVAQDAVAPHAAAIVGHGGAGTTLGALAAACGSSSCRCSASHHGRTRPRSPARAPAWPSTPSTAPGTSSTPPRPRHPRPARWGGPARARPTPPTAAPSAGIAAAMAALAPADAAVDPLAAIGGAPPHIRRYDAPLTSITEPLAIAASAEAR